MSNEEFKILTLIIRILFAGALVVIIYQSFLKKKKVNDKKDTETS
jgi:hypothetical protein